MVLRTTLYVWSDRRRNTYDLLYWQAAIVIKAEVHQVGFYYRDLFDQLLGLPWPSHACTHASHCIRIFFRYPQRIISDQEGVGHFYSNVAMDHLLRNEIPAAYTALRQAATLAPNKSFIWNNMGIVQRRLGNLPLAEVSYRQALQVDPRDLTALTNLAGVYEEMGNVARAAELRDYGYQIKLRDPFFRYALAENAYKTGEYDEALRQLDAALRRNDLDHRFHYLRGLSFWELGDERSAIASLRKAIRIAGEPAPVGRYQRTLEAWTGT